MRELLQIGEVAKLIGVSPKTIRYYHEIGLLAEPKRTGVGYRLYTAQDLLRLSRKLTSSESENYQLKPLGQS
jgi:DNA-binding transcriptional MerR regulator